MNLVFVDERSRSKMAERRRRPELRLHVQTADHRQQFGGQDVVPLQIRGRQLHVGVREHGRH